MTHKTYHIADWREDDLATLCLVEDRCSEAVDVVSVASSLFHSLRRWSPDRLCWQCHQEARRLLDGD